MVEYIIKSIIRCVISRTPVMDIESGTLYYPYRWELFRKWNIKTGYVSAETYDEQCEYLGIIRN